MICLLEERVCNLVLLWCITVIAHYCKLVKLQSTNSDYHKQSDLWYDDIEFTRHQNDSNIGFVKNHQSYYKPSNERKHDTNDHSLDDLPIIRGHDMAGRTSIEVPVSAKMNDGEISISKKITFNGNNSRSNNHQLWFNALEKSALSLPSFSFNSFKNPYAERKVESTKRPYEGPGSVFASKPIPLSMNATINRNKIKYQPSYEQEYDEPALPPSLPNLEIIPFVASDALDKPKDTMIDRKESIEYAVEETTPVDSESQVKKFSPPVRTEGGFVPRDPTLDELYFKTEYNRTHSTPSVPEITSEIRTTQPYPDKVPEVILEDKEYYSSPATTEKSTTVTTEKTTAQTTRSTTTEQISSTSTTQTMVHFIETTSQTPSPPSQLNFSTTTTTTSAPKFELNSTEDPDEYEEESATEMEEEPVQKIPPSNHTKEEGNADPEENSLLNNILTMIFDDYPTTKTKPLSTTKKPTYVTKTTPMPKITTIPPFKHLFVPTTENNTLIRSDGKIEFNSTKLFGHNNTVINETQQNLIKYISSYTNPPIIKTTGKPVTSVKPPSYSVNEIFSSMKTDSMISGLLKLSGCNIFGKMYKTGELIEELSESCSRCVCSESGVHCIPVKC